MNRKCNHQTIFHMEELKEAIEVAIEESQLKTSELHEQIKEIKQSLKDTKNKISKWCGNEEMTEVILKCSNCDSTETLENQKNSICKKCGSELEVDIEGQKKAMPVANRINEILINLDEELLDIFERQEEVLNTFNIVMFGRTGTGKSTLSEIFTRGSGESISSYGRSDYTTEVSYGEWGPCRIYDTPGIEGLDDKEGTDDLEKKARRSAQIADIVLLCFDNQNQQIGEFKKVFDWVVDFNKPVIPLLNVRNGKWRMPDGVPVKAGRRSISKSVSDNAANIISNFAKLSSKNVTPSYVLAMNFKKAHFGSFAGEYKGPDKKTCEAKLKKYGREEVIDRSNFNVLVKWLREALLENSSAIRLGMLEGEVEGILNKIGSKLSSILDQSEILISACEKTLSKGFEKFGYPVAIKNKENRLKSINKDGHGTSCGYLWDERLENDLLTEVETLRGSKFNFRGTSSVENYIQKLVKTKFDEERKKAMDRRTSVINKAFEENKKLDATTIKDKILPQKKIQEVIDDTAKEARKYLKEEVEDFSAEFEMEFQSIEDLVGVKGDAGDWLKFGGGLLRGTGILAMGGSAVAWGLAASNMWNPSGWVIGGLLVGGTVLSFIGKWLGGSKAEKKKQAAKNKARSELRTKINDTFKQLEENIIGEFDQKLMEVRSLLFSPILKNLCVLHTINKEVTVITEKIQQMRGNLQVNKSQKVIEKSSQKMLRSTTEDGSYARPGDIFLGENWIDDHRGLEQEYYSGVPQKSTKIKEYQESLFQCLWRKLTSVFKYPKQGAVQEWLNKIQTASFHLKDTNFLKEIKCLAEKERPNIILCGDYSAGKSAFIKRLLIEFGNRIPESLKIGGDPVTKKIVKYVLEDFILIDTPGFQANEEEMSAQILKAIADASLVFFIFQPYALTGNIDYVHKILDEHDKKTPGLSKYDHSIYFINKSDELGVNPDYNPDGFHQLCEAKRNELSDDFETIGLEFDKDRMFVVASDPYSLVSDRVDVDSAHYEEFRSWDGFNPFLKYMQRELPKIKDIGIDASILEGGIYRLYERNFELNYKIERLRIRKENRENIIRKLKIISREGMITKKEVSMELRSHMSEIIENRINDIVVSTDDHQLKYRIEELKNLWDSEDVKSRLEEWYEETQKKYNNWWEKLESQVEGLIKSAKLKEEKNFHGIDFSVIQTDGTDFLNPQAFEWSGRFVKNLNRDVVYKAGKMVGVKFKPWGAVNLTTKLNKLAPWLGAVGTALEIYSWWQDEKKLNDRSDLRSKIEEELTESTDEIHEQIFLGNEQTELSDNFECETNDVVLAPGKLFEFQLNMLKKKINYLENETEDLEQMRSIIKKDKQTLCSLIEDANKHLGHEESIQL